MDHASSRAALGPLIVVLGRSFCHRIAQGANAGYERGYFPVIASEAKQSSSAALDAKLDCFVAEPVIGRVFARPVGSSQ
jgi:hypothetical protein